MLRVLADVALGCEKKRRPTNPMCSSHGKVKQRQTCFKCIGEDMAVVNANPFLTRWDAACILNSMSRSYACGLCFLVETDVKKIRKATDCKLHSVHNEQRRCFAHNRRWTECSECLHDVRAGTSNCRFCGLKFSAMCKCPRGPEAAREAVMAIDTPQPADQIELKAKLAASALDYAAKLQAAQGDPGAIFMTRAVYEFPDCSNVRSVLHDPEAKRAKRKADFLFC